MRSSIIILLCMAICIADTYAQINECKRVVQVERSYLYDKVNTNGKITYTKRTAFLVKNDELTINCSELSNDYIYVSYLNKKGATTRGFLRSTDLVKGPNKSSIKKMDGNYSITYKYGNGADIYMASLNDSTLKFFISINMADESGCHCGESWGYASIKNNTARSTYHYGLDDCELTFTLIHNNILNVVGEKGDCSYSAKAYIENRYKLVRSNVTIREIDKMIADSEYFK